MKKEGLIINFTGILFLTFGILAIINTLIMGNPYGILWFCYPGLIILGLGFVLKKRILVESQMNILLIPLSIWTIDFIYYLFFNHSLFNIVDYFFTTNNTFSKIITLQHLFTIPLALYSIKFIKPKKNKSYLISFIYAIIIFLLTRLLTSTELNMNWVYRTSLNLTIPFYPIFWMFGIFLMIFLTNKMIKRIK